MRNNIEHYYDMVEAKRVQSEFPRILSIKDFLDKFPDITNLSG